MNRFVVIFLFLLLLPSLGFSANWEELEGCQLISSDYNDGDSFLVRHGSGQTIFRLYFVDTPETSPKYPDRLKEQASYFGISSIKAVELGNAAKKFTAGLLLADEFSVWTRFQKVWPGQRIYGLVELQDGRWLDQRLVAEGLARIYGKRITLPGGQTSREHLAVLGESESTAKSQGKGGWNSQLKRTGFPEPE